MSEAKRYEIRRSLWEDAAYDVWEPGAARVCARTLWPKDAEHVARLLNAEAEVRNALSLALERFTDPESPDGNRIRSALSALGESPDAEAVRP